VALILHHEYHHNQRCCRRTYDRAT